MVGAEHERAAVDDTRCLEDIRSSTVRARAGAAHVRTHPMQPTYVAPFGATRWYHPMQPIRPFDATRGLHRFPEHQVREVLALHLAARLHSRAFIFKPTVGVSDAFGDTESTTFWELEREISSFLRDRCL